MNAQKKLGQDRVTAVSFGAGTYMVHLSDLFRKWAPYGVTEDAFIEHLLSIGVPIVHMPSGDRFVDLFTYQVALRALSSWFEPSWTFPDTTKPLGKRVSNGLRTRLVPALIRPHLSRYVGELILARKAELRRNTPDTVRAFHSAMERLSHALCQHLTMSRLDLLKQSLDAYTEFEVGPSPDPCPSETTNPPVLPIPPVAEGAAAPSFKSQSPLPLSHPINPSGISPMAPMPSSPTSTPTSWEVPSSSMGSQDAISLLDLPNSPSPTPKRSDLEP